jgi:hypothetical protein
MYATPTPQLLDIFRAFGQASTQHFLDVQARSESLLKQATDLSNRVATENLDNRAKLSQADQVMALCAQAIYVAHGLFSADSEKAFSNAAAISALAAELQLSNITVIPMHEVRSRVLTQGPLQGALDYPEDAFLAHQGVFLCPQLVDWTAEHVKHLLAH